MKYSIYTLTVLSFLAPIELYSKEGVPAGNSVKIAKSHGDSQKLKQMNKIESNKKIYKILENELKDHIHSLQILIQ